MPVDRDTFNRWAEANGYPFRMGKPTSQKRRDFDPDKLRGRPIKQAYIDEAITIPKQAIEDMASFREEWGEPGEWVHIDGPDEGWPTRFLPPEAITDLKINGKVKNKLIWRTLMENEKGNTNEHINIQAEDGRVEIVHRYGAAANIQEPEPVIISGTIDAPAEYYEKRREIIDTDKAYLSVNETEGTIILRLDPASPIGERIQGSIKVNPLLELMRINGFDGRTFNEDDFVLMLKQTRSLFEDQSDNLNLVDKIKNLEIKVNREIDRKDDERGSKKDYFEQFCEAELPGGFNLHTNIFVSGGVGGVGHERSFYVELKYHYKSQLHFWLESPDLQDMKDTIMEQLMGSQINRFEDEIPIIYK